MTAPHFLARLARSVFVTLLPIAFLLSCSTTPTQTGPTAAERAKTIIANPIRTDQDRRMDESRNPAEFLPFTGVKPGMMVLDVSAGAGYTSQLLALSVAPDGKLWAQREQPGAPLRCAAGEHGWIDEAVVLSEFKQAGFVLEAEGQFLRNPADTRDFSSGDGRVLTDKFALRFVKPN